MKNPIKYILDKFREDPYKMPLFFMLGILTVIMFALCPVIPPTDPAKSIGEIAKWIFLLGTICIIVF